MGVRRVFQRISLVDACRMKTILRLYWSCLTISRVKLTRRYLLFFMAPDLNLESGIRKKSA